mgnify:CR=1 FL=1
MFTNEKDLEKSIAKSLKDAKVFEHTYKDRVKSLKTKEFLKALNEYEDVLEATANSISAAFAYGNIISLSFTTSQVVGISIDKLSFSIFTRHEVVVVVSPLQETIKKLIKMN